MSTNWTPYENYTAITWMPIRTGSSRDMFLEVRAGIPEWLGNCPAVPDLDRLLQVLRLEVSTSCYLMDHSLLFHQRYKLGLPHIERFNHRLGHQAQPGSNGC